MDEGTDDASRVPRIHPLEVPFIWFGIQLIEFAAVWLLVTAVVPQDIPAGVGIAVFLAVWVPVSILNYRIRRRFIPR
jgi:hypothetical protein